LKRLFNIKNGEAAGNDSDVLICELSNYHICYAIADAGFKKVNTLIYYESETPITAAGFSETYSDEGLDENEFSKRIISCGFPQVAFVPVSLFKKDEPGLFLEGTGIQQNDPVYYDDVTQQNLAVVYSLPQLIADEIMQNEAVEMINSFTPSLKNINAIQANDQIHVQFNRKEIRILVVKNNQLQLAQTYAYAAPLDVVYYLLAICNQFELSQSSAVVLAGLIDENSAMYKELHQYFSNMSFAGNSDFSLFANDYPQHFFSSIYNLASCVL
jgi:hypothetical protein